MSWVAVDMACGSMSGGAGIGEGGKGREMGEGVLGERPDGRGT